MQHLNTFSNPRALLLSCIDSLLDDRDAILSNPQKDFTRNRMISFRDTMLFPMIMGNDDVFSAMTDFFPERNLPSESAMIQQRNKIKPLAFRKLFEEFRDQLPCSKLYHGYRLVACDGSRLNLPYNPSDLDTFCNDKKAYKGFNQVHLNTFHDICNNYVLDVVMQTPHSMNEREAFLEMLSRYSSKAPTIFVADRGYSCLNLLATLIHSKHKFLFRITAPMFKSMLHDDAAFEDDRIIDRLVLLAVTRSLGKKTKQEANDFCSHYHYIKGHVKYDFLGEGKKIDYLCVRLLKIPISDGCEEYIVTNLPECSFTISMIKELYHLRWGIETSYRDLKYSCSLVRIHSLKRDLCVQEIFAKLILYNFASFTTSLEEMQKTTHKNKYEYKINFRHAIKRCIDYLKKKIKNLSFLIQKKKTASKPGRNYKRHLRTQAAVPFNNR